MAVFAGSVLRPARFVLGCSSPCFRRGLSVVAMLLAGVVLATGPVEAGGNGADPAPAEAQPEKSTEPSTDAKAEASEAAEDILKIRILMARELPEDELPPLSLLDIPPPDNGLAGAKLAIDDNNTTGRFLKQEFILETVESPEAAELVDAVTKQVDAGFSFVVADTKPETLLKLSDALKDKDAVIFNAGAPDETLREENCRVNIKHTAPSRSMLADALAQYIAWKRWGKWLLVVGPAPEDQAYADALKRAAKRFGLKIVDERKFEYEPGSRRADGGFEQIQQQIPSFMQGAPEHDVVVVADEGGQFGEYFPYRTWISRPVIGSAGLIATSWHPAVELWGGTQFQNRFKRLAKRQMRPLDYNAWTAVRAVGEAATRTNSADPKALIDYMLSPKFDLAAFKGQKLTFRSWNGQLRQPIFITTAKLHVTVSPQPGFLHEFSELDTLGVDEPETKCTAFKK